MNVVACFDDDFCAYAGTMLTSLFENHKGVELHVYLLSDYISDSNLALFHSLAERYRQDINFIYINIDRLRELTVGMRFEDISIGTYYRLFLVDVLPPDVKKVLYLDSDIIVNGSLVDLWNTDITNYCVAAVEDKYNVAKESPGRLGYPATYSYFNAGVLLLNVEALRKMGFVGKAFDFMIANKEKTMLYDQDVLNGLLYDKKLLLPIKYNMIEVNFMRNPLIDEKYKSQLAEAVKSPVIIHFTGAIKPWHIESKHTYTKKFLEYKAKSPWNFVPLKPKYDTPTAIVKFRAKNFVKKMLALLGYGRYVYLKMQ